MGTTMTPVTPVTASGGNSLPLPVAATRLTSADAPWPSTEPVPRTTPLSALNACQMLDIRPSLRPRIYPAAQSLELGTRRGTLRAPGEARVHTRDVP